MRLTRLNLYLHVVSMNNKADCSSMNKSTRWYCIIPNLLAEKHFCKTITSLIRLEKKMTGLNYKKTNKPWNWRKKALNKLPENTKLTIKPEANTKYVEEISDNNEHIAVLLELSWYLFWTDYFRKQSSACGCQRLSVWVRWKFMSRTSTLKLVFKFLNCQSNEDLENTMYMYVD